MSTSNYQIKNEEVTNVGGFVRSLVVDVDTNHPRAVWRSDRSNGNSPNAGTYQKSKDGDIVIVVTIQPQSDVSVMLNFNRVIDGQSLPVDAGFNFYPVINNITPLVSEWLYDTTSRPYLPRGIGWDGENPEIERIKMEKALSVLPKEMPIDLLKEITAAIAFTSINVFNDILVKTSKAHDTVEIPSDCNYVIQADKNNNFICISEPEIDKRMSDGYVITCDDTVKLYIIWYSNLKNNASKKIALEIIELV